MASPWPGWTRARRPSGGGETGQTRVRFHFVTYFVLLLQLLPERPRHLLRALGLLRGQRLLRAPLDRSPRVLAQHGKRRRAADPERHVGGGRRGSAVQVRLRRRTVLPLTEGNNFLTIFKNASCLKIKIELFFYKLFCHVFFFLNGKHP